MISNIYTKMIVTLNVGGTTFVTTDTTLLINSAYFRALFKKDQNLYFDANDNQIKNIFIDRSPRIFEFILNYLRDPSCKISTEYENELIFYGIKYDETIFETNEQKQLIKIKQLKQLIKINGEKLETLEILNRIYRYRY